MEFSHEFVPGNNGPVMGEPLIGVDHTGKVDARFGVADQLGVGQLGHDDREGRRGDQVRVAKFLGSAGLEMRDRKSVV